MSRHNVSCEFLLLVVVAMAVVANPGAAQERPGTGSPVTAQCDLAARSNACSLEESLLAILRVRGVEAAMATLDSLAAERQEIRRDGHNYAHAIGIAAYTGDEEVGTVFNRCTPAFQSGCYHGVIQAYFTRHAAAHGGHLDGGLVNSLCLTQREDDDRWLLFQCAHGMGHGLVMLGGYHLPTALDGCDLLIDPWERESCYGGVFMENIVHATVPHHTTGRPEVASHGDHADPAGDHSGAHDHSTPEPEEFPPLNRDDPLYPCSVLEERYLTACYQMQTSAILFFNGSDIEAAIRVCGTAPDALKATCFQSLGRDISSITLQDHGRAMRLCATVPAEYQPSCTIGYAKNLVDVTADPADGFAYCRLLPAGESKRVCYVAIGEQIWVLADALERREVMCLAAEAEFVGACRYGAGLDDVVSWIEPTPMRGGAVARLG